METIRLLLDLDGTAAEFKPVDTLETLYEEGYFRNLKPNENVINAIKNIIYLHPEIEVYVMSSVLSDSKYALKEKNEWIDEYLPQIDSLHRIFPPCGENKLDYVPDGIRETDHLLDDYTKNLVLWEPPAKGIKLLNGINHTHETWQGSMLRYDKAALELADDIVKIMKDRVLIQDEKPQQSLEQSIKQDLEEIQNELSQIKNALNMEEPHMNNELISTELQNGVISLEERYIKAMELAGYVLIDTPVDAPVTLVFMNVESLETNGFDGWEMVGQELENLNSINESNRKIFEELIHPQNRVEYYVSTKLETPNLTDLYDYALYEDFDSALKDYLSVEEYNSSMGYMVEGQKFELTSFDDVSMEHLVGNINWKSFPNLAQNEIREALHNLEYLKEALNRRNTYHALREGFNDIAVNYAKSEIVATNNVWGAWIGRIANKRRPQDYVEVDLVGILRENKIICDVSVIHANIMQESKRFSFDVNPESFKLSVENGMTSLVDDFSTFINENIDLLDTDLESSFVVYSTEGKHHSMQEHYEILENNGYDIEPDKSTYVLNLARKTEIESLATKMDNLIWDYDPYGYAEVVGEVSEFKTSEEFILSIASDISDGNVSAYIEQFEEMILGAAGNEEEVSQYKNIIESLKEYNKDSILNTKPQEEKHKNQPKTIQTTVTKKPKL